MVTVGGGPWSQLPRGKAQRRDPGQVNLPLFPPRLRFLTCDTGTVAVPWFLGLNCKAPRTGWHRLSPAVSSPGTSAVAPGVGEAGTRPRP